MKRLREGQRQVLYAEEVTFAPEPAVRLTLVLTAPPPARVVAVPLVPAHAVLRPVLAAPASDLAARLAQALATGAAAPAGPPARRGLPVSNAAFAALVAAARPPAGPLPDPAASPPQNPAAGEAVTPPSGAG